MSITQLQYRFNFTLEDVAENREGELSERQIEAWLQPIDSAFVTMLQSFVISAIGIGLAYAISTIDNLPLGVQFGLAMGAAVMFVMPMIAFILYRRVSHLVGQGDVGTLSRVRKQDFMPFDDDMGERHYHYETGEATIVFDQETMNALEPDVAYNIYYWTDGRASDIGNDVLSIEAVEDRL